VRICIVSQEYPPVTEYHGGIGTQYGKLAPELARLGHEVHAVVLAPADRVDAQVTGVHVHPVLRPRVWPWYQAEWARRVDAAVRELGPFDAVLCPEYRGEAAVYARHQSSGPLTTHLLTSARQLLAIRPGLTWSERNGVRARLALRLERLQAEHSNSLLAPGRAVLEWARELWALDRIPARILPLVVGVDEVRAAAASGTPPPGFPEQGPVVTFASRMDGHKGAQHLMRAMHDVWRSHADAQLVYVGRDARWKREMMSDHLRALAGDRAANVHILGYQPAEPYFAAVAASDLVAIPSMWESYCLAAVEAMVLGKPVIGTTENGFSEFIEDGRNGLLVGRGDVPELAAAVSRLLDDASLRASVGAAAEETGAGHAPSTVARLYVAALEGGGPAGC
jgi:glycosyltransferase involved in cell wall biosynthesis